MTKVQIVWGIVCTIHVILTSGTTEAQVVEYHLVNHHAASLDNKTIDVSTTASSVRSKESKELLNLRVIPDVNSDKNAEAVGDPRYRQFIVQNKRPVYKPLICKNCQNRGRANRDNSEKTCCNILQNGILPKICESTSLREKYGNDCADYLMDMLNAVANRGENRKLSGTYNYASRGRTKKRSPYSQGNCCNIISNYMTTLSDIANSADSGEQRPQQHKRISGYKGNSPGDLLNGKRPTQYSAANKGGAENSALENVLSSLFNTENPNRNNGDNGGNALGVLGGLLSNIIGGGNAGNMYGGNSGAAGTPSRGTSGNSLNNMFNRKRPGGNSRVNKGATENIPGGVLGSLLNNILSSGNAGNYNGGDGRVTSNSGSQLHNNFNKKKTGGIKRGNKQITRKKSKGAPGSFLKNTFNRGNPSGISRGNQRPTGSSSGGASGSFLNNIFNRGNPSGNNRGNQRLAGSNSGGVPGSSSKNLFNRGNPSGISRGNQRPAGSSSGGASGSFLKNIFNRGNPSGNNRGNQRPTGSNSGGTSGSVLKNVVNRGKPSSNNGRTERVAGDNSGGILGSILGNIFNPSGNSGGNQGPTESSFGDTLGSVFKNIFTGENPPSNNGGNKRTAGSNSGDIPEYLLKNIFNRGNPSGSARKNEDTSGSNSGGALGSFLKNMFNGENPSENEAVTNNNSGDKAGSWLKSLVNREKVSDNNKGNEAATDSNSGGRTESWLKSLFNREKVRDNNKGNEAAKDSNSADSWLKTLFNREKVSDNNKGNKAARDSNSGGRADSWLNNLFNREKVSDNNKGNEAAKDSNSADSWLKTLFNREKVSDNNKKNEETTESNLRGTSESWFNNLFNREKSGHNNEENKEATENEFKEISGSNGNINKGNGAATESTAGSLWGNLFNNIFKPTETNVGKTSEDFYEEATESNLGLDDSGTTTEAVSEEVDDNVIPPDQYIEDNEHTGNVNQSTKTKTTEAHGNYDGKDFLRHSDTSTAVFETVTATNIDDSGTTEGGNVENTIKETVSDDNVTPTDKYIESHEHTGNENKSIETTATEANEDYDGKEYLGDRDTSTVIPETVTATNTDNRGTTTEAGNVENTIKDTVSGEPDYNVTPTDEFTTNKPKENESTANDSDSLIESLLNNIFSGGNTENVNTSYGDVTESNSRSTSGHFVNNNVSAGHPTYDFDTTTEAANIENTAKETVSGKPDDNVTPTDQYIEGYEDTGNENKPETETKATEANEDYDGKDYLGDRDTSTALAETVTVTNTDDSGTTTEAANIENTAKETMSEEPDDNVTPTDEFTTNVPKENESTANDSDSLIESLLNNIFSGGNTENDNTSDGEVTESNSRSASGHFVNNNVSAGHPTDTTTETANVENTTKDTVSEEPDDNVTTTDHNIEGNDHTDSETKPTETKAIEANEDYDGKEYLGDRDTSSAVPETVTATNTNDTGATTEAANVNDTNKETVSGEPDDNATTTDEFTANVTKEIESTANDSDSLIESLLNNIFSGGNTENDNTNDGEVTESNSRSTPGHFVNNNVSVVHPTYDFYTTTEAANVENTIKDTVSEEPDDNVTPTDHPFEGNYHTGNETKPTEAKATGANEDNDENEYLGDRDTSTVFETVTATNTDDSGTTTEARNVENTIKDTAPGQPDGNITPTDQHIEGNDHTGNEYITTETKATESNREYDRKHYRGDRDTSTAVPETVIATNRDDSGTTTEAANVKNAIKDAASGEPGDNVTPTSQHIENHEQTDNENKPTDTKTTEANGDYDGKDYLGGDTSTAVHEAIPARNIDHFDTATEAGNVENTIKDTVSGEPDDYVTFADQYIEDHEHTGNEYKPNESKATEANGDYDGKDYLGDRDTSTAVHEAIAATNIDHFDTTTEAGNVENTIKDTTSGEPGDNVTPTAQHIEDHEQTDNENKPTDTKATEANGDYNGKYYLGDRDTSTTVQEAIAATNIDHFDITTEAGNVENTIKDTVLGEPYDYVTPTDHYIEDHEQTGNEYKPTETKTTESNREYDGDNYHGDSGSSSTCIATATTVAETVTAVKTNDFGITTKVVNVENTIKDTVSREPDDNVTPTDQYIEGHERTGNEITPTETISTEVNGDYDGKSYLGDSDTSTALAETVTATNANDSGTTTETANVNSDKETVSGEPDDNVTITGQHIDDYENFRSEKQHTVTKRTVENGDNDEKDYFGDNYASTAVFETAITDTYDFETTKIRNVPATLNNSDTESLDAVVSDMLNIFN